EDGIERRLPGPERILVAADADFAGLHRGHRPAGDALLRLRQMRLEPARGDPGCRRRPGRPRAKMKEIAARHRHGFLLQLHLTSRENSCGGNPRDFTPRPRRRSMKACAVAGPLKSCNSAILQSCHDEIPMTDYERFVNTEALLACQRPIDGLVNSHELFFQVTHQVMELWMKVIAYELTIAIADMGRGRLPEATLRLHRVREIERVLVDQMAVMETLAPADYHPIRMTLGHGSGQESPGFNRILNLAPDVSAAFGRVLTRAGVALLDVHRDRHAHQALFALVQGLMDVDSWFQRFREAHYHVVKRVIGSEVRSLKGIPASRLEQTSKEPLFPELWDVINDMTRLDWPRMHS